MTLAHFAASNGHVIVLDLKFLLDLSMMPYNGGDSCSFA